MSSTAHGGSQALGNRDPRNTELHRAIHRFLPAFLQELQAEDRSIPSFAKRELERFLACGILENGFARLHCNACNTDHLIAFSCKSRSICPSCTGRRMADTAAHWVDRVIPEVPTRQYVLSFPFPLRYALAYDKDLTSEMLNLFIHTVLSALRRRARREFGLAGRSRRLKSGALTVIQRFGDGLRLNPHFHAIVVDGVYEPTPGLAAAPHQFHALPPPDDEEIGRIIGQIATKTKTLLLSKGLLADSEEHLGHDPLAATEPLLATLSAASITSRIAIGPRAGHPLERIGAQMDVDTITFDPTKSRCASAGGLNLHADVAVPARDRRRLERLSRYLLRPPFAGDRISILETGRVLYRLKQPFRDGTTHLVFEPLDFVAKLIALVPPPRANQVRYHGVFAPAHPWRDLIVPSASKPEIDTEPSSDAHDPQPNVTEQPAKRTPSRPRRLAWAELLKRSFAADLGICPTCGARRRVLDVVTNPSVALRILDLGAARAPPKSQSPTVTR